MRHLLVVWSRFVSCRMVPILTKWSLYWKNLDFIPFSIFSRIPDQLICSSKCSISPLSNCLCLLKNIDDKLFRHSCPDRDRPTGSQMEGYPDLYELRKLQRDNLQLCLQTFTGPLELVLDRTVIPSLDRIAGMKFLTENGVQRVHKLDASQIEIKSDIDKDWLTLSSSL